MRLLAPDVRRVAIGQRLGKYLPSSIAASAREAKNALNSDSIIQLSGDGGGSGSVIEGSFRYMNVGERASTSVVRGICFAIGIKEGAGVDTIVGIAVNALTVVLMLCIFGACLKLSLYWSSLLITSVREHQTRLSEKKRERKRTAKSNAKSHLRSGPFEYQARMKEGEEEEKRGKRMLWVAI